MRLTWVLSARAVPRAQSLCDAWAGAMRRPVRCDAVRCGAMRRPVRPLRFGTSGRTLLGRRGARTRERADERRMMASAVMASESESTIAYSAD